MTMTDIGRYLAKKSASKAEIAKKTGISKSRISELTLNPSTQLRVRELFSKKVLHDKTVSGHYRNWSKQGVWKACWANILSGHKSCIDLSSGDLDGSHTTALKGGKR